MSFKSSFSLSRDLILLLCLIVLVSAIFSKLRYVGGKQVSCCSCYLDYLDSDFEQVDVYSCSAIGNPTAIRNKAVIKSIQAILQDPQLKSGWHDSWFGGIAAYQFHCHLAGGPNTVNFYISYGDGDESWIGADEGSKIVIHDVTIQQRNLLLKLGEWRQR